MRKSFFLYLIIYAIFSSESFSQNFRLKINGNNAIETKIIDSLEYKKFHKDLLSIKAETDSVQQLLFKKGFVESKVIHINKINDSVFNAKLHLKRRLKTITVYYDKNSIEKSVLTKITPITNEDFFVVEFSKIENILNNLNQEISKEGLPFLKLKLDHIKITNNNTLTAELVLDRPKKKRTINDIIIKGYEKFPRSYLKHFLKIKTNSLFSLNEIKTKTKNLQNLRFANEIKSPEVLFSQDSTTLYLYLKKAQSNAFDGFLGFGSNEETSKIQFDGYLNLNLTNNLNFGESFKLLYKSDENDQKTFQANLTLPYILKSPVGLDFSLNIFRKDSTFSTVNQSAKLHYQINAKHKIFGGIINEESNNLLNNSSSLQIADYTKTLFTLSYEFNRPQTNNLFPAKTYLNVAVNSGNRKDSNRTEQQNILRFKAFNIFNFNRKNSIYLNVDANYMSSDTFYDNELFRFGGINSIRGFEENSLFANLFGVINSEYRFQLNNAIYLHTVIDAAYYENNISNTTQKLFGYGFGFGVLTKSGLFKLTFANGKNENQKFKLSNSKLHISLTTYF
ncbi:POTRA domain-containing protein [Seonamhaeicola marinus]|uniref:POTRA domain-containing protein n=1 Tax=Seonamhaeicola marinus TaxID=1912246 RepID=A0A5D0HEP6_9FLAO|nr:POTRA domain-containing protein [Seonamhaeicola marinus]TYA69785.1 hypothetical protein FUA24_21045 [Seonamhaeicola marinus]